MCEIIQVKPRWQITIPRQAREALATREGEYLAPEMKGRALILKPMRPSQVRGRAHPAAALKSLAGSMVIGGKVNFHDALLARTALSLGIPAVISFDANLDTLKSWKRIGRPGDV
jgi:bifunctional DNA-binding transcriptional regulator/antitoxin component of YhaV-PrlF toxin-antitoxin module